MTVEKRRDKINEEQQRMLFINAARDCDRVAVRRLSSAADAQSLTNYQDGNGATPLYKAGSALQGRTDAHRDGYTPLFIAAANGHASVTKQLIEARCNMDLKEKDGSSPLYVAASIGHASVTKQLIEARCNVDLPDKDRCTPLHLAADKGHEAVTKQLIAARCNVNLQEAKFWFTPLHFAAHLGQSSVPEQLLAARCNVDLQSKCGPSRACCRDGAAD